MTVINCTTCDKPFSDVNALANHIHMTKSHEIDDWNEAFEKAKSIANATENEENEENENEENEEKTMTETDDVICPSCGESGENIIDISSHTGLKWNYRCNTCSTGDEWYVF